MSYPMNGRTFLGLTIPQFVWVTVILVVLAACMGGVADSVSKSSDARGLLIRQQASFCRALLLSAKGAKSSDKQRSETAKLVAQRRGEYDEFVKRMRDVVLQAESDPALGIKLALPSHIFNAALIGYFNRQLELDDLQTRLNKQTARDNLRRAKVTADFVEGLSC